MTILAALLALLAADLRLGKPLALDAPTPIEKISAEPERYVGRAVQVKGKVTEVCEMMGCWMNLAAAGGSMRIKVNDGDIVFPKTAIGKTATAEGKLVRLDLTREQAIARARHEADEQGRKFDPASVKGPAKIYMIQGTGAVIVDP
ncbi:MAG: DUF4920 domain-containing protein [Bryobacteraceae bacterium]